MTTPNTLPNRAAATPIPYIESKLIFERSREGRRGASLPASRGKSALKRIPESMRRKKAAPLPEVSELDVTRHYTLLSQKNYSVDTVFYPLGSCTMKFNPRACEAAAAMPGFTGMHPYQQAEDAQGTLGVFFELQQTLADVTGLPEVTLTPVAGAQGEFCGVTIIHAWHKANKTGRHVILVPDSAHGTNPASAAMAGFDVRSVASTPEGLIDLEALKAALDNDVAALMLTNPNTCGLFERNIIEAAKIVHDAGALLYYDGANLNAIVGRARPGDMGFDVVHLNLHKSFSTPHGGGGPGAGPVAVREDLAPFLPRPRVVRDEKGLFCFDGTSPESVGRFHAFYGNAAVLIRAYAYIRIMGGAGLRDVATYSVLNANYLLARLKKSFDAPFAGPCKHEFILSLKKEARAKHIIALDISKRLLDFGIHPPTNYFPLLVPECLLIEPTETESKETLDRFVAVMEQIRHEIDTDPDALHNAPSNLPIRRADDVLAVKQLNLCYACE
ncbi:aminomethyl-transferring glycine dehydrogenase subunit GcvPB [bacterium]|nr:aminomethyl-transferring glycine dehydrogenase subunit GcvPB [bacterium]